MRFDKLTKSELDDLKIQLNQPMTEKYKDNFWQKTYINENLLNDNMCKHWSEDIEFCKCHGMTVRGNK